MKLTIVAVMAASLWLVNSTQAAQDPVADRDWADIEAAFEYRSPQVPAEEIEQHAQQLSAYSERWGRNLMELGLRFFERHPDDPRRWEWLLRMDDVDGVKFIQSYGPEFGDKVRDPEWKAFTVDEAARAAWVARYAALRAKLAEAPLTAQQREEWERQELKNKMWQLINAQRRGEEVNMTALQIGFTAYASHFPEGQGPLRLERDFEAHYINRPSGTLADKRAWLERIAVSPNIHVRTMGQAQSRIFSAPLQMKFTALDGRKVDLAELRGKIVLIDYWATWCPPCVAELPNVKEVYGRYRERGFEVIGISLDAPKDRRKLERFVAEKQYSWPQCFDGQGWKSEYVVRYGIMAVPTMLLLDRDGNVVSANARGETLEREVKRLLGN